MSNWFGSSATADRPPAIGGVVRLNNNFDGKSGEQFQRSIDRFHTKSQSHAAVLLRAVLPRVNLEHQATEFRGKMLRTRPMLFAAEDHAQRFVQLLRPVRRRRGLRAGTGRRGRFRSWLSSVCEEKLLGIQQTPQDPCKPCSGVWDSFRYVSM